MLDVQRQIGLIVHFLPCHFVLFTLCLCYILPALCSSLCIGTHLKRGFLSRENTNEENKLHCVELIPVCKTHSVLHHMPGNTHMAWHLCWPWLPLSSQYTTSFSLSLFLSLTQKHFLCPWRRPQKAKKKTHFPISYGGKEKRKDMGRNATLECHYNG